MGGKVIRQRRLRERVCRAKRRAVCHDILDFSARVVDSMVKWPTGFHRPFGGDAKPRSWRECVAQLVTWNDAVERRLGASPLQQFRSCDRIWWMFSGSSMTAESSEHDIETLRLPRNWHSYVRHAVLNVVGIVRIEMLAGREALITNGDANEARIHQLESEVAMLREELRIVGARMQRVPAHRRPRYIVVDRMATCNCVRCAGGTK